MKEQDKSTLEETKQQEMTSEEIEALMARNKKLEADVKKLRADKKEEKQEKASVQPPVQKVKIKLYKDSQRYKDDVFVAVNGQTFLIQRGVEVEVPDFVAEVLKNSAEQDAAAAAMIETKSSKE